MSNRWLSGKPYDCCWCKKKYVDLYLDDFYNYYCADCAKDVHDLNICGKCKKLTKNKFNEVFDEYAKCDVCKYK